MTPQEKALELYNKMYSTNSHPNSVEARKEGAKEAALIAVDEIINSVEEEHVSDTFNEYWQEIKQEIEKL